MKKKSTLFLFLILMLNFILFAPINANAELKTGNNWRIDWDDFTLGLTSGAGTFYDWARSAGDDFRIYNDYVNSSPRCLWLDTESTWAAGGRGDAADSGTINLDLPDINYLWMDLEYNHITGGDHAGALTYFRICNGADVLLKFLFVSNNYYSASFPNVGDQGTDDGLYYYDVTNSTWVEAFDLGTVNWIDVNLKIEPSDATGELVRFSWQKGGGSWGNKIIELENPSNPWVSITKIQINSYIDNGGTAFGTIELKLDDFVFYGDFADVPEEEEVLTDINFKVYDGETGDLMNCYGHDIIKDVDNYYLYTELHSDLWEGDYNSYGNFGTTISIENVNISLAGGWHYFNMTYVVGFIDPNIIYYYNSTNYLFMYPDQTYTIYVSSVSDYGGFSNCDQGGGWFTGLDFGDNGFRQICTDKEYYTQGESINFRYVTPDPVWLYNYGSPSSNYFIWLYDSDYFGFFQWYTDGGISADNYAYMDPDWKISLDNSYHYLHWDYDPGETFGYKTATTGVDKYRAIIGHGGGGLFGIDYWLCVTDFYIVGGDFTPYGNFTSVSPTNPKLGQFINISFEANNNGYITVKNVLSPGDAEQTITNFQKFTGIEHVNKQFFDFGSYELKLYVSGGAEYAVVDTYTFDITDINGSYGDFGFGIEFLTVEPERAIAGYDVVFINYRSLDDTGMINVLDARGQTTSYGSIVGTKRGTLNITLPNHAAIGEWNITLTTANSTLYSSFNVIAEENNWVEFYSNVYYKDGQFELKLKHDKKIELVFSKDGQDIGTNWYLDIGQMVSGIFPVPLDKITLTPGSWKVEMWQVNNFVKIKKLAEDTCIVIDQPAPDLTEGGYDDIFSIMAGGADSIAGGGFGLAFIAIMFILATIVSLSALKLKNDTIFLASIIMTLFMVFIGWLPLWIAVVSIVLAGLSFSSAFSKKLKIGN